MARESVWINRKLWIAYGIAFTWTFNGTPCIDGHLAAVVHSASTRADRTLNQIRLVLYTGLNRYPKSHAYLILLVYQPRAPSAVQLQRPSGQNLYLVAPGLTRDRCLSIRKKE